MSTETDQERREREEREDREQRGDKLGPGGRKALADWFSEDE